MKKRTIFPGLLLGNALICASLTLTVAPAQASPHPDTYPLETSQLIEHAELSQTSIPGSLDTDTQRDMSDIEPTIVGGNLAPEGAYPWAAQLRIKVGEKSYRCGGTIVSKNIVITAQHCAEDAEAIEIYYNSTQWGQGSKTMVKKHIDGAGIRRGDWSVLLTADVMTPASLPKVTASTRLDDGPFRSMGWGKTAENEAVSDQLRYVDLPKIDDEYCEGTPDDLCAGDRLNGGIDTCHGDSGGPLLSMTSTGPVLVGIVSWGNGCAQPRHPGHYTRISYFEKNMAKAVTKLRGQMWTRSR